MSKKITDLPAATTLASTDLIPIVDLGATATKKITRANFQASLQITQDQILPGWAPSLALATGGSGPLEIGATWTPTFNASYTPDSVGLTFAHLTDSDAGSEDVLGFSNPLTPPSLTYTKTAVNATETLLLTATRGGITKTDSIGIQWLPLCWSGVGTAGATGLNGTSGALVGATGTLSGALRSSRAGVSSVSPSVQKIYFACPSSFGAVSFKDQNGFTFAMNSPSVISVTNSHGVVLNYALYESTNVLSTAYVVTES